MSALVASGVVEVPLSTLEAGSGVALEAVLNACDALFGLVHVEARTAAQAHQHISLLFAFQAVADHGRAVDAVVGHQIEAWQARGAIVGSHRAGPAVLVAGRALVLAVDEVALAADATRRSRGAVLAVGHALLAYSLIGHVALVADGAHCWTAAVVAIRATRRAGIAIQVVALGTLSAYRRSSA